eukprot:752200-Hanusia_phi.AAC.1
MGRVGRDIPKCDLYTTYLVGILKAYKLKGRYRRRWLIFTRTVFAIGEEGVGWIEDGVKSEARLSWMGG